MHRTNLPLWSAILGGWLLLFVPSAGWAQEERKPLPFTGINLAGADFNSPKPGQKLRHGFDYFFPAAREFTYFAAKGCNVVRLPFLWENLQPELGQPFDAAEMARIEQAVADGTGRGMVVILDVHNYARHFGRMVGEREVSTEDFAVLWRGLAERFRPNERVWFGLMNEPHGIAAAHWVEVANVAIAAIRATGAKNQILVPGTSWTGAHSWFASGNADALGSVVDPGNNYVIEAHQYLDADSSGTKPEVVSATVGSERLEKFTRWCRAHGRQAFLGEFGTAYTDLGKQATEDMLAYMENNRDVWVGWTWWAAGAYWGDYPFSVQPAKDGTDAPLLRVLAPHLQPGPVTSGKP